MDASSESQGSFAIYKSTHEHSKETKRDANIQQFTTFQFSIQDAEELG